MRKGNGARAATGRVLEEQVDDDHSLFGLSLITNNV